MTTIRACARTPPCNRRALSGRFWQPEAAYHLSRSVMPLLACRTRLMAGSLGRNSRCFLVWSVSSKRGSSKTHQLHASTTISCRATRARCGFSFSRQPSARHALFCQSYRQFCHFWPHANAVSCHWDQPYSFDGARVLRRRLVKLCRVQGSATFCSFSQHTSSRMPQTKSPCHYCGPRNPRTVRTSAYPPAGSAACARS